MTSGERVELIKSASEDFSRWVGFADADDANAYVLFRQTMEAPRGELIIEVASGLDGESSLGGLFLP